MRIWAYAAVTIVSLALSAGFAIGPRSQAIDEWDALDRSLRNAKSVHPNDGFVPDEATAVKVGEAVAIAQYGETTISHERPFRARLRGGIWTVQGTLHPEGAYGGTAVIRVRKEDGAILFMTHQY